MAKENKELRFVKYRWLDQEADRLEGLDRLVYRFRVPPRCSLHSLSIEPAVTRFYEGLVSKRHQLLSYHQSGVMIKPSFHLVPDDDQEITIVVEHEAASPGSPAPLDARRIDLILSGPLTAGVRAVPTR